MKISKEFLVSFVLLLAAGVGLRCISYDEMAPLRQSFAEFPLHIEPWSGRQLEWDPQVLKALSVDDYLLRQYRAQQGLPIEIYIGYYKNERRATYHTPQHCLPGAGWVFLQTGKTSLQVASRPGQPVEVNQFIIQKGLEKQLLLYWYQDRGRIITNADWVPLYRVWDAVLRHRTDGAFVRITVPLPDDGAERAVLQARAFAETIFPLLAAYLPS